MSKVVVVIREGGEEDWGDEIELLLNIVKDIMDNLFHKSACEDVYVEYSEYGPMVVLGRYINKKCYNIYGMSGSKAIHVHMSMIRLFEYLTLTFLCWMAKVFHVKH